MQHRASLARPIALAKLRPWKNPRGTKFQVDDLVESLDHAPLLQNVVVRRIPGPTELYEVICGARRVEAMRQKGYSHVEAKIVDVSDEVAETYSLEENLRRKALPDETKALARLVQLYEKEQPARRGGDRKSQAFKGREIKAVTVTALNAVERAARMTGQSAREVRRKARIGRKGTEKLRRALAEGQIPLVAAEQLSGLPANEQDRQLRAMLRPGRKSDVAPEIERTLDALSYVARVLSRYEGSRLPPEVLAKLKEQHEAVGAALDRLKAVPSRVSNRSANLNSLPTDLASPVRFEPATRNQKLAPVAFSAHKVRPRIHALGPFCSSTSVSMAATCPESCAFRGAPHAPAGCYVESGFTKIVAQKLDRAAQGLNSLDVIRQEVQAIDDSFNGRIPQDGWAGKGRDLRLHTAGDCLTADEAKMLGRAAARWTARGGGSVWTFTHSWRTIPRSAWGPVSAMASVENPADIQAAQKRGYATALVVGEFAAAEKAFEVFGSRVLPCRAETAGQTCIECRLCLQDRSLLAKGMSIGLQLHGQHERAARDALARVGGSN